MFELDQFVSDCRAALATDKSHKSVREVVARAVSERRESMRVIYRIALATFTGFALTVAIASHSIAQQQQLIGTWLLVSEITEFPDGKRLVGLWRQPEGHSHIRPHGSLFVTTHGRFAY